LASHDLPIEMRMTDYALEQSHPERHHHFRAAGEAQESLRQRSRPVRNREEMVEPGNGAIGFADLYKPVDRAAAD
jgi:hypothetical protein